MTNTESLSARIARLEADVAYIPEGRRLLDSLDGELRALMARLDEVGRRLAQAEMSERLLEDLRAYTDRLLTSGTLVADVASAAAAPQEPDSEPAVSAPLVAETPTDTPAEVSEGPTEVSEQLSERPSDSQDADAPAAAEEQEDDTDRLSQPERVAAWVEAQGSNVITVQTCAAALDIPETSVGTYLGRLAKRGKLTRIEGTGRPGVPSEYQLPGSVTAAAPEEEQPAYRERILQHFQREENRTTEFNAAAVQSDLEEDLAGLSLDEISGHLDALTADGLLESADDDDERWYSLVLTTQERVA